MTSLMGAVAAATATLPRVYATNSVPAKPEYPYAVYSSLLGRGDTYTLDSATTLRWGRVTVQAFGRTSDAALSLTDRLSAALLDKRLSFDGYRCTPCRLELDPSITRDPDDQGVVGVTATYNFTASKETP